jgi:hypothetical protein
MARAARIEIAEKTVVIIKNTHNNKQIKMLVLNSPQIRWVFARAFYFNY